MEPTCHVIRAYVVNTHVFIWSTRTQMGSGKNGNKFKDGCRFIPWGWRLVTALGLLWTFFVCSMHDIQTVSVPVSFSNWGTGRQWRAAAMLKDMVVLDSILLEDDIRRIVVSDNAPDADMMLVEPNGYLQSSFHVANPGHPYGIVQYVSGHSGERAVTEVFHHVLRKRAKCGTQDDAVVLDIGANTGFYSMLALSEGCQRVLLFDPQPSCVRHIAHALVQNAFEGRAGIVPHFVDVRAGRSVELELSANCEGRWPIGQLEDVNFKPKETKSLTTVAISDVIPMTTRIAHAKVDTEGGEYYVLLSMLPFFKKRLIDSVIFEITPMWWIHNGLHDRVVVIEQFITLITQYSMHCRALDAAPWNTNQVFTRDNVTSLSRKINETYQTDFWFYRPGMDE